jgi:hypothetical protein
VARLTFLGGGFNLNPPPGFEAALANGERVTLGVATPGAGAVFAVAGIATTRHRRSR